MRKKQAQRTWTDRLDPTLDWPSLLLAYQDELDEPTGKALLEALAPAARKVCNTLLEIDSARDPGGLWQAFQSALLYTARFVSPGAAPEWIPVRLLQGARRRVSRQLVRECRFEVVSLAEVPQEELLAPDVAETVLEAIDYEHPHPLYRRIVLGESYAYQAERVGVAVELIRQRASRDARRLRQMRDGGYVGELTHQLRKMAEGARPHPSRSSASPKEEVQ